MCEGDSQTPGATGRPQDSQGQGGKEPEGERRAQVEREERAPRVLPHPLAPWCPADCAGTHRPGQVLISQVSRPSRSERVSEFVQDFLGHGDRSQLICNDK